MNNQPSDSAQKHQITPMHGELVLYNSYPFTIIETQTASNADFCALNAQDCIQFANVLEKLRQNLWEEGGKQPSKPIRSLAQIFDSNYQWKTPDTVLALGFNHDANVMGLKLLQQKHCELSLEQVVELIQVIELFMAGQLKPKNT